MLRKNIKDSAAATGSQPHIPFLKEDNVRVGFFEREQFLAVLAHLPEPVRPAATFAYLTGSRIDSEVLSLEWRQVDFGAGEVRLDPGKTKNGEGRTFPMTRELREVLEQQRAITENLQRQLKVVCPRVFHRRGRPIKSFRVAFRSACVEAGCPGRVLHDFRRTAVRNLVRAGIPERVAMQMTGHKTRSDRDCGENSQRVETGSSPRHLLCSFAGIHTRYTRRCRKRTRMRSSSCQDVTQLLAAWSAGNRAAAEPLIAAVYSELKRLARSQLAGERGHTLQPTVLVHEAYMKLVDQRSVHWRNRAHFLGIAAQLMRRIVLKRARRRAAAKRGGGIADLNLDDASIPAAQRPLELIALDAALTRLAAMDTRQSQVVELRYFGGLDIDEIAAVLGISSGTVKRDWRSAKAWLHKEIAGSASDDA